MAAMVGEEEVGAVAGSTGVLGGLCNGDGPGVGAGMAQAAEIKATSKLSNPILTKWFLYNNFTTPKKDRMGRAAGPREDKL
jgi:hypothetical protein